MGTGDSGRGEVVGPSNLCPQHTLGQGGNDIYMPFLQMPFLCTSITPTTTLADTLLLTTEAMYRNGSIWLWILVASSESGFGMRIRNVWHFVKITTGSSRVSEETVYFCYAKKRNKRNEPNKRNQWNVLKGNGEHYVSLDQIQKVLSTTIFYSSYDLNNICSSRRKKRTVVI
jgi:hypothetical protein